MGEDKIIDFESLKMTLVFWNIDEYPVDTTGDLSPIFGDISKALAVMGFRNGFMDVILYSEQVNCDKKEADLFVHDLPQCESYTAMVYKVPDITLYMIRQASMIGPGPANFMVIAKPARELDRVLQCLKSRRHNVVLVVPPPDEEFLVSVDSLLNNARLLGGGKPRDKAFHSRRTYQYDLEVERDIETKEDVSKMVDFSERIPTVKGVRTAVFWDAVDCPFPRGSTPDEIYRSISSALVEREFSDKMTIWAYLDDDDKRLLGGKNKTWASRIHFLPGGDKASRRVRMLNDINLWLRDSPQLNRCYEVSLVLFSDQFKDAAYYTNMLQKLANLYYDVLLVTPTLDINKPESPEWPGLLIDRGAYLFDDETIHVSREPCPTQHEATAEEEEETPEMLPIMSGFGDDETSEDEEMLLDTLPLEPRPEDMMNIPGWPGWKRSEEITTDNFDDLYRWDPITMMYKLKILFTIEEEKAKAKAEADAAAKERNTCKASNNMSAMQ